MNRIEYILYVVFVYNIYDTYAYVHIYATKTADNMFLGTVILGEEVNFYYMSYSWVSSYIIPLIIGYS